MPTFVTEGLIFGKPSIVSEHTGTAGLITEGVDGFVYKDDDPDQLAKVLEHAILHPEQLAAMKADCRKMYEKYYSNEAYVATPDTAGERINRLKNKIKARVDACIRPCLLSFHQNCTRKIPVPFTKTQAACVILFIKSFRLKGACSL